MQPGGRGMEWGCLDSKQQQPWESVREYASDARMRIAAEIRQAHAINVQRLPSLLRDEVSLKPKDCGLSSAASLSSLLDKVLLEHASAVPSRRELVVQKQHQAAAAAKSAQTQLQPLGRPIRGRRGAAIGNIDVLNSMPTANDHSQKRFGRLPDIGEVADDETFGWNQGKSSNQQCDGVSIKSRMQSRQGIEFVRTDIRSRAGGLKSSKLPAPALKLQKRVAALIPYSQSPPLPIVHTHQGLIFRLWHNPRLDDAEEPTEADGLVVGDVPHASLFECAPHVVVVVACSHTSMNHSAREAVVAGSLRAQAQLQCRSVCVQTVMDTIPAVCDEILPLSVSFFDFPPRNLLPRHSKVLLITSSDDTGFHLRPPLTLPPSCIMSVNTVVDTTPALRPHKQNIKGAIMAAYQPSASFDEAFVLKASLAHNVNGAESREDALDAAYVLAFLAFACEPLTADAVSAVDDLQRICFENTAARRDADLFRAFGPHVISLALNSNPQPSSPGRSSDDSFSVSAAAKSIGASDRVKMRRMLSGAISAPAAASAAKRSDQMRRDPGTFLTQSDIKGPRLPTSSSIPSESAENDCSNLQNYITASVLSFCASISHTPASTPCPLLTAAIARLQLSHSVPFIPCTPPTLLRDLLTSTVQQCRYFVTEKCGCGPESFELQDDDECGEEKDGANLVFPVHLVICCKNHEVMRSMAGIVGCFCDDWLASALHAQRRFVSVYVDVSLMGADVGCADVLECIVLQLHAAIRQRLSARRGSIVDWKSVTVCDTTSAHALRRSLASSCNVLLETLDVSRILIILNAADRVRPNNDLWLPSLLPKACCIIVSCSDDWGAFAACMLCSGMPNSALFVIPDNCCVADPATLASLTVVDGRITSAPMADVRFDARSMSLRVLVNVTETVAFRLACGLRELDDDGANGSGIKVEDLRLAAARLKDHEVVQLRMIVLLSAGTAALAEVEGMNALQLRMWLLENICRPHSLPWQAAARIVLYLCVSSDGLPLPMLIDVSLLDYAMDMNARNLPISPSFVPLCRAAVPCLIHSCARVRIACASQRFSAYDGVLWKIASSEMLLSSLEAAGGLTCAKARSILLEYFEGGMKRLMTRLNHAFHDHAPPHSQASTTDKSSPSPHAINDASENPAAASKQNAGKSLHPSAPHFNLRRMSEGTQLALTIGDARRAAAFVIPCVRDAFAAGFGGWSRRLLELIVCAVRGCGSLTGDLQRALQWWIFVNVNFSSISRDFNAFVAAARQWDVHGVVYESMLGRVKGTSMNALGKNSLAAVAAATASASLKLSASPAGASSTYLQYPQRHSFPTVSYQQRCRFSFARGASQLSTVSGDGRLVFDVDSDRMSCRDLTSTCEMNQTRLWIPSVLRIAAAASNFSGSAVFLVVVSKGDALPASDAAAADPQSPGNSPGGSSVNSIDVYSLRLVEIAANLSSNCLSPAPTSSSVADAKLGMAAVEAQLAQLKQRLAALGRRRNSLPVTDPQEPRLRREINAVKEQVADLQRAQRLLHRDCAAAVLGGDACKVLVDAALDARSAVSSDFNLTICSACEAPGAADLHLSAASWPASLRQVITKQGVRVYDSDKAVALSADGRVSAHSQGNAVRIHSKRIVPESSQSIGMPNSVVALALNQAGNLMAAAVTSLTGGSCIYMFHADNGSQWSLAACIDDNYLMAVTVLTFSADISSFVASSSGAGSSSSSSSVDANTCVFALSAGGQGAGLNGRFGSGGVVKVWKVEMQQQHQHQHQQQQQQQPLAKKSLRQFVKGSSRVKQKEAGDSLLRVGQEPLACFFIPREATNLHVTSLLPPSVSPAEAAAESPPSSPARSRCCADTHGLLLHISSSGLFCSINLSPLPSQQQVCRVQFVTKSHSTFSGVAPPEASATLRSSYYDAVQAPLVSVLSADGCVVTLDELGNAVVRELGSGAVAAVAQKKDAADSRVVCLCYVSKRVRQELAGGGADEFPAFFAGHEGGFVGVYSHSLDFMCMLNPLPPLPPPAASNPVITCMACTLGKENSALVLGLADGRIVLYDLDGGDAAEAITSAASVARSQPLVIEQAGGDAVWGICCFGSKMAVARGRLSLKLLDVGKGRKIVASMTVSNDRSIVAALFQQQQRIGVVMLLQDDGALACLEWKGGSKLKLRCQRSLDIHISRGAAFAATGMDVHWGVDGIGSVAAVACSAPADCGCGGHVLLVDGATLSVLRVLPVESHGIRALLLLPLPTLLGQGGKQSQLSRQESRRAKGCEFQNLAIVSACADGTLLFDSWDVDEALVHVWKCV